MPSLHRRVASRLLTGVGGVGGVTLLAGVTLLVGVTLLATGCGGGGGSHATTVPPSTVPVSTTTPPPGRPQLQSIVVQAADLPAGWMPTAAGAPADPSAALAFAQCVGTPDTSGHQVAVASSPNFVKGTAIISSTAASFRSPADVQADTAALSGLKASACFSQEVKSGLAAGLPKGTAVRSVNLKITPGTGGGPANVVATATGTIAFTTAGKTSTVNDTIVFFAAPRIEAHVDFFGVGNAIPASVKTAIINKVSTRVQNGS
jgi:hypothetical protein